MPEHRPLPDHHAFAATDGGALDAWRSDALEGAACVAVEDGHGSEVGVVLERGEVVALALHLLRIALGPEVAEAVAQRIAAAR